MRFHVLATDYDGTLAHDGRVADAALDALEGLRRSGRRVVLVTGRMIEELRAVFPELELFDAIVAENGALLYDPASGREEPLAEPPPEAFVETLRRKGVSPLDTGRIIVATRQPHEREVVEAIREAGLDLTVIFNKGAVMVLPSNVNKATGLAAQLARWKISFHNVAGVGDAENDLAFLARCEAAAAVANALPSVRERADVTLAGRDGAGVAELAGQIVADDLRSVDGLARRRTIALGRRPDGPTFDVSAATRGILLAGTSGGGKSSLVAGFVERLAAAGYQHCIVDPEGDYAEVPGVVTLGDAKREPTIEAFVDAVTEGDDVVLSLVGVPLDDRPGFAARFVAHLAELHAAYGRPHWLVIDEAHHLFPASLPVEAWPADVGSLFAITTRPELVAARALRDVEIVVAVGEDPHGTLAGAGKVLGVDAVPAGPLPRELAVGEAVVWDRRDPLRYASVATIPGTSERLRHVRKYSLGELAEEKSFYFTGPQRKLKLRAQNLMTVVSLAEGVDDETWCYHLDRHEYSGWIREAIGDRDLADAIRAIEDDGCAAEESRVRIIELVRERYTAPA